MTFIKKSLYLLGLISFLTACSSSSDGGDKTATITAENSKDLAIAATESTKQAITTDSANFFNKSSPDANSSNLIANKVREIAFEATSIGTIQEICPGGGSYSDNINFSTASESASGTIIFDNCDTGEGFVISGSVTFSGSENSFTLTYTNLTYTGFGLSETLNATITCNTANQSFSCSTSTSITGIDGRTYGVSSVSVTGNDTSGYNVSATVVDPTHGTITVNATSVTFDCTSPNIGRPGSGSITFSSNGKSGSVTFDSCSSYTVTVDGVGNTYTW